jgi:hypothetical protein
MSPLHVLALPLLLSTFVVSQTIERPHYVCAEHQEARDSWLKSPFPQPILFQALPFPQSRLILKRMTLPSELRLHDLTKANVAVRSLAPCWLPGKCVCVDKNGAIHGKATGGLVRGDTRLRVF